jgi:outer membrane protein assembly factor BamB
VFLRDVRFGRVASAATGTLLPGLAFDQPPAIAGDVGVFMDGPVVTARSIVGDEELWSFTADGTAWPAPLIVGGHVYVGSDTGALNALDLATGESVWDTTIVGGVAHSAEAWLMPAMAAGDGLIVVPGADGSLVAFAHEAAPPAARPAPSLAPLDLAMPSPPAGAAVSWPGRTGTRRCKSSGPARPPGRPPTRSSAAAGSSSPKRWAPMPC